MDKDSYKTERSAFEMKIIARIRNDFPEKFGIPRQSGLVPEMQSVIIFEEEYRKAEALRGIDGYSHLWLIWQFSENLRSDGGWTSTVRPPRLGGNKRMGVFATRSPFRPNPIGLSSVALLGVERSKNYGTVLRVSGADLMDNTPIFDIKPYLAYTDSHPGASGGFSDDFISYMLNVSCPPELLSVIEPEKQKILLRILQNDPRPSYQHDDLRIYRMSFGHYTVSFTVEGNLLTVTDICSK